MKRSNVYWVNLDPTIGSEIKKKRPCVVIGVDPVNMARRTVVVIPLSTSGKEYPPLAIGINCMNKKAVAVIDQIRAVDKSRFIQQCDRLDNNDMTQLEQGIKTILGV
ncbi:MAG: type II toxin-antitoxin system PemK/MazF family toxin [Elusimicrobia bacterium]|nr:type II toxin-antitoxin system PemK/MazF family toxin [Elusimicrobiota bacterium]